MAEFIEIRNIDQLREVLESGGVDATTWKDPAVLESLFSEIQSAECQLRAAPIERHLRIVRLSLKSEQTGLVLVENSVRHADGHLNERGRLLSEKIIGSESPFDCARRAIAEELLIADPSKFSILRVTGPSFEYRDSAPSYPGLRSRYEIYDVSAQITGLPPNSFSTIERAKGAIVATHSWSWSREIPNIGNS